MRRNDREITDPESLDKILKESSICRVALFDDEFPYVVPMNYGYKDQTIYFHCATEGRKLDLIRKNNKVGFEVEHSSRVVAHEIACGWTTKYCSVIGTGTMEILDQFEDKVQGLNAIMEQHGRFDNAYDENLLKRVMVLKLSINSLTGKESK